MHPAMASVETCHLDAQQRLLSGAVPRAPVSEIRTDTASHTHTLLVGMVWGASGKLATGDARIPTVLRASSTPVHLHGLSADYIPHTR